MANDQTVRAAPRASLSTMSPRELIDVMREFRARTIDLIADLDNQQMIGPRLSTVNPPLW